MIGARRQGSSARGSLSRRTGSGPRRPRGTASGFTLVEILVAVAILALVAVLAWRATSALADSEARLAAEADRWRTLEALFARLESDLRRAQPREVRVGSAREAAWVGQRDDAGNSLLRLSRAGPEFTLEPGSAGQRIGYRLRNGALEILYWPHLDLPATSPPAGYVLAEGVARFEVAYLDSHGEWRDRWPRLGDPIVPRAVRVALVLDGGEAVERLIALQ
jgi:general secretion pathway protein J